MFDGATFIGFVDGGVAVGIAGSAGGAVRRSCEGSEGAGGNAGIGSAGDDDVGGISEGTDVAGAGAGVVVGVFAAVVGAVSVGVTVVCLASQANWIRLVYWTVWLVLCWYWEPGNGFEGTDGTDTLVESA